MSVEAHKETLGFQTEVNQLLDLMIHSLYSNKEIFLRELISNAADATDKLRFEALADDALYEGDTELSIRVDYDKTAGTITVTDNGIGMNRQEVVEHIGTIAKSGTRQFFDSLTGDQAKDAKLIGQFGVGFYSTFIVADRVTLTSRRAGLGAEHGVYWESTGKGEYTLETIERAQRGTEIVLHLKKDEDEFLDGFRLRNIIKKYSDHITLPIIMHREDDKQEDETVNRASAMWARPKSDISDEEYNEFYKHIAHDFEDPLAHVHSRVEGKQEYTSLLYIPAHAPFDLWDHNSKHGIKLYVRRVFIMDDAEQLMPNYLRFVRGIVDSSDLPLNVSREILQHSKDIDAMRAGSTKKVLAMLETLANSDSEKYGRFWNEFGRVIKEGIVEDVTNRDQIAKLLRFSSTTADGDNQEVSLSDYVGRMKDGQENIYYVTADSYSAASNSPHLEIFHKKDIEVLLLHDRIDEWVVNHLTEFDGKPLQSASKGDLDLGALTDEKGEGEKDSESQFKELLQEMQKALDDRVKEVRISRRLTSSPACLVADNTEMGGNMERILQEAGHTISASRKILEINPEHPLVGILKQESGGGRFNDLSHVLFDQALLAEGGQLDDPAGFVHRLNDLLLQMSGH